MHALARGWDSLTHVSSRAWLLDSATQDAETCSRTRRSRRLPTPHIKSIKSPRIDEPVPIRAHATIFVCSTSSTMPHASVQTAPLAPPPLQGISTALDKSCMLAPTRSRARGVHLLGTGETRARPLCSRAGWCRHSSTTIPSRRTRSNEIVSLALRSSHVIHATDVLVGPMVEFGRSLTV